jgi:tetraacyldisaccharide 4'-kinase
VDQPVLAFSGIGAPERFFGLLGELGARLVAQRAFPDHHMFTDAEARALIGAAEREGAMLCTTEKDWLRLPEEGVLGVLRSATRVLSVRLEPEERDRVRLKSLIEGLLAVRGAMSP